ncbi:MAG: MBL fold metallo-hydrolase [Planctomycetota bacterium]|jgi:ribonuclease BN (tRNA processing enzyme)
MKAQPLGEGEKLSLQNDGTLELFFIGTGSAFARTHGQTNFLIIKGSDHVMVDFGMTGPMGLRKNARLEPTDVEVLLPTHSHADHVGGIECLALMNRYAGQRFLGKPKLKIVINEEYQRILWEQTLRGGLEWNEEHETAKRKLAFGDFFDVVRPKWKTNQPREIWTVRHGGIDIDLIRTKHIPEQAESWEASFVSFGLLIDGHIFVSGDTRFDTDLLDIVKDAEWMFHDVQFFPGAVHAPLDDLKTLPGDAKKKMFLIHYADDWEKQDVSDFAGFAKEGIRYIFD